MDLDLQEKWIDSNLIMVNKSKCRRQVEPNSAMCPLIRNTDITLGYFSKCVASSLREVILTPYLALVSLPPRAESSFGLLGA